MEPPEGGILIVKFHLVQPLVLLLLVSDVLADQGFVATNRGHKRFSCPEVLPDKVAFPFGVHARQVDRTLSLLPDAASVARQRSSPALRNEHDVIFTIPLAVV